MTLTKITDLTQLTAADIPADADIQFGIDNVDDSTSYKFGLDELKKTGVQVSNVMQFGAIGDGATDDTASLQAAIDDAETSGAVVYLPPGQYKISTPLRSSFGVTVHGSTMTQGVTELVGSGLTSLPIWRATGPYTNISNLKITNEVGDGLHIVSADKSLLQNIWSGRGVRDVAFMNAGSQQLQMVNCWATSNSPIKSPSSSVIAKYGFLQCSYAITGSAIATPSATGLNGLTLTLNFVASSTFAVTGNTIDDLVDSINAAATTTGVMAARSDDDVVILYSRSFDASTGVNDDHDMVLTDGTGTWAAAGFTAGTKTYGTAANVVNASVMEFCHAEGCGFVGVMNHAPRHSDNNRGDIYIASSTIQGNGTGSGPTYLGDVVFDRATDSRIVNSHLESSNANSLTLYKSHNSSIVNLVAFDVEILTTYNASFVSSKIRGGQVDANSHHATFCACEINVSSGTAGGFSDLSPTTAYIGGQGTNAASSSSGTQRWIANSSQSASFCRNGDFEYWDAGVTAPLFWTAVNTGTGFALARGTDAVSGTYSADVTATTGTAESGIQITIPATYIKQPSGYRGFLTVSYWAKRKTSAATQPGVIINAGVKKTMTCNSTIVDEYMPIDTWVQRRVCVQIADYASNVLITLCPDKAGAAGARVIFDRVSVTLGQSGADQFVYGDGESADLFIGGRTIDYGAAAPTTGTYNAGSIRFNNAPTSGGLVGWVCTAAGSPGTWKTFGSIS